MESRTYRCPLPSLAPYLSNGLSFDILNFELCSFPFNASFPFLSSGNDTFTANEEGLGMLMSMGFTREQATLALKETSNNLERAADWIFSHQHELDSLLAAQSGAAAPPPQKPNYTDGEPK